MKPAASLTGSLLARKGFAVPSAPPPFQPAAPRETAVLRSPPASETARPAPTPVAVKPRATAKKPAAGASKAKRVALTLRLDPARHLQLRLLAAHHHMTSQDVLTAALDAWLEQHACSKGLEHCACLAAGVATDPVGGCSKD